jgi:hypothetical protein
VSKSYENTKDETISDEKLKELWKELALDTKILTRLAVKQFMWLSH